MYLDLHSINDLLCVAIFGWGVGAGGRRGGEREIRRWKRRRREGGREEEKERGREQGHVTLSTELQSTALALNYLVASTA